MYVRNIYPFITLNTYQVNLPKICVPVLYMYVNCRCHTRMNQLNILSYTCRKFNCLVNNYSLWTAIIISIRPSFLKPPTKSKSEYHRPMKRLLATNNTSNLTCQFLLYFTCKKLQNSQLLMIKSLMRLLIPPSLICLYV